jgi:hypothetical protein
VRSRRIGGGGDIVTSPPVGGTPGFEELFDGTSLGDWTMSTIRNQPGRDNSGSFLARAGILEARPGTDIGLLWLTARCRRAMFFVCSG